MEFNSVAITAAGSGVDAVALEWLEHTIRTEVSSILRWNKGGWWGRAFRSCRGLGGWCEADSYTIPQKALPHQPRLFHLSMELASVRIVCSSHSSAMASTPEPAAAMAHTL